MDHKTWLSKRKSAERTPGSAEKVNLPLSGNEVQTSDTDVEALEMDVKTPHEKLSSALSESNAKDDIVEKQTKLAQEAIAGWEKAEAKAISRKQELDKALIQSIAGEERSIKLVEALKECMQQLRFTREEQEKRIHDAVMRTSREFEHIRVMLEEKLAETNKRLAKLGAENTKLSEVLLAKEKVIDDLNKQRAQAEVNYSSLMTRLESVEKGNSSLKYEVWVLEKELEIRNEEREFISRTADTAHKQHLESAKKIAKLESECQRPCLLAREQLPGPAALANMNNEVKMLGRNAAEAGRRKSSFSPTASVDFSADNASDIFSKRIDSLTEQFIAMEEENRHLKESINDTTNELQISRTMYARAASKLSQIEAQLEESSRVKVAVELATDLLPAQEISVASFSDLGSENQVSNAESWGKQAGPPSCRTVGSLDMNLMDDFVEMEKLATVSSVEPSGSFHFASEEGTEVSNPLENQSAQYLEAAVKERVVSDSQSGVSMSMHKIIELIEAISAPSADNNTIKTLWGKDDRFFPYMTPETSAGYVVRLFQWKTSELNAVLKPFIQSCHDLLDGKVGVEKFAEELTSALEWIVNHCFSLQDVSSMRNAIKKHYHWDGSRSDSEVEGLMINQFPEAEILHVHKEHPPLPMDSSWKVHNNPFHMDEMQPNIVEKESISSKHELEKMESLRKDLEGRLQLEIDRSESLIIQLQESEKTIKTLQTEVEALKKSKEMMENQTEIRKMVKEDLDSRPKDKVGLNEACKNFLTLEKVLVDKNKSCEKLEATCLNLQLQVESITQNIPKSNTKQEDNQLRPDWEIIEASEKLVECQETILNLGKQLKALAPPRDAALFNKVITTSTSQDSNTSTSTPKKLSRRSSLHDKMLAEDTAETENVKTPKTNELICTLEALPFNNGNSLSASSLNGSVDSSESLADVIGIKHLETINEVRALAMMLSKKKRGLGFLRNLFRGRRKKQ